MTGPATWSREGRLSTPRGGKICTTVARTEVPWITPADHGDTMLVHDPTVYLRAQREMTSELWQNKKEEKRSTHQDSNADGRVHVRKFARDGIFGSVEQRY
jgi:hypothetical protein